MIRSNTLFAFVTLLVASIPPAIGQAPIQTMPTTSPYEDHGAYSINLQNLNVVLTFPIVSKAGAIPFNSTASGTVNDYGSASNSINPILFTSSQFSASASPIGTDVGMLFSQSAVQTCSDGTQYQNFTNFAVASANGSAHPLANTHTLTVPYFGSAVGACITKTSFTDTTVDSSGIGVTAQVYDTGGSSNYNFSYTFTFKNGMTAPARDWGV